MRLLGTPLAPTFSTAEAPDNVKAPSLVNVPAADVNTLSVPPTVIDAPEAFVIASVIELLDPLKVKAPLLASEPKETFPANIEGLLEL